MSKKDDFVKATFLIAICSLLSRILGLLRSTLLGSFYGATKAAGLTDCYAAAFRLPDIIFNLIVFGAISIVLIPYFSQYVKKDELDRLKYICSTFLNFFFLLIIFFLIIGFFFAPFIVRYFLLKGWTNEENILLTIKMTRILLIQVLFMSLSGILGSYLNAIEKFLAYSLAILSYNIGIILGILLIAPFIGIEGVAWGAVLGSLLHFSIQAAGALVNGFHYHLGLPKMNQEIKKLLWVAIPRIIGISGEQLVKFFIVNIASFLFVGSIFIYENAENFSMVPFGMIAVSISTTTFPIFSKLYTGHEYDELLKTLLEKLRGLIFFILPVTIFMIIFRREIIEILLTYKKFSPVDAVLTADALAWYMVGIPFFSLTIVIVKYYYAQQKSVLPMIVTIIFSAVTVAGCYFFSHIYQISGLSMGRSLGYIVQTLLLIGFLYYLNRKEKMYSVVPLKPLNDGIKIIVINAVICILALLLQYYINFTAFLSGFIHMFSVKPYDLLIVKLNALLKLGVLGFVIATGYLLLSYFLKIPEINLIRRFSKSG